MKNILEYLEETVMKYPDKTAVDDGKEQLTWKELQQLARTAGTVLSASVQRRKPVVVLKEKSSRTLAVMFGAVYAGCFYVIIDPHQPPARIRQILAVVDAETVVTDRDGAEVLEKTEYSGRVVSEEELLKGNPDEEVLHGVRQNSQSDDLLYGIFTSGSTGTPKGVAVSHQAVIDFIGHFIETFGFTENDRIGNQAPFDFDVSVKDIYTCVMTGAALILIPREKFVSPVSVLDYICEKKVTVLIWAVSALCLISSLKGLKYRKPEQVKKIFFSGEVMPARQLRLWMEALPDTAFTNLYGPSEITCNCTYYQIPSLPEEVEKLPIGRSFPGRQVFLMDDTGHVIKEQNKTGEICVAGESLASGYYHNPEETARRFCSPDPSDPDQRYYRTGDLGYLGADGNFYFSGRKDFQIKHMGHRIELEEIERNFETEAGVERSCCLLDERRNQLVAFYIGEAGTEEIRSSLKEKIPSFMIPHKIIRTDRLPLNKNGKTDRGYLKQLLGMNA